MSKKRDIERAVRTERERCCELAAAVALRYAAMGFRHDARKAEGAKEVLRELGGFTEQPRPYEVQHVAGLTAVYPQD